MRPLELRLQGLRSYREEQVIDFSDKGLVAIVGDTGAGKSSLLEALTVALYGTSTWDARETKQLISDGAGTLQVSLTFRAEGKVWRVERAISRSSYPPARHTLERLAAEGETEKGERLDKKDAVDDRIRQLVGLDYDAFLRSVVLPQGRFAALLQAKPAERAQILKGILRLDRLDQVREQAIEARGRLEPVDKGLRERRGKLLPDPAAALADAEQRLSAATAQRTAARAARQQVTDAKEQGRAAAERAERLKKLVDRANEGRVEGAATKLGVLREREAQIEAALSETEAALVQKRAEEEELASDIEEAERKGAGPVSLANAKSGLSLIGEELPLVSADAAHVQKEESALARDAAELSKAEELSRQFVAAEAEARKALSERQAESKRAAETLKSAERLSKDLRKARSEEAKAAKKVEKAEADLAQATSSRGAAEAEAKKAEEKLAEAEAGARAAARKHAAHHAAEGARPGDPCPVCERALPDDFRPPRAPAVESAQKKVEKARNDHAKARDGVATARSKTDTLREGVAALEADLAERHAEVRQAASALEAVLPGVALDAADAAVLGGASAAAEAAASALAEAEAYAQKTRDVVMVAKAELDAAKKRHKERRDALQRSREALAARRKRLDDAIARLPADLRPKSAAPGNKAAPAQPSLFGDGAGAADVGLSASDVQALIARVDVRRAKIDEVVKRLDEARAGRRALEIGRERLVEERQRDVTAKAGALEALLATWRERLSLLSEGLLSSAPAERPESAALREMAAWAGELEAAATELVARGEREALAARAEAASSAEVVQRALSAAGAESEAALEYTLSRAEGQMASAEADLARARADLPLAAALDARIGRAQSLLLALSELTRLVADGKLIAHVVQRRQRVLLAVASELLGSMTRGRYGFSESFEVVDNVSGLARGTRTLSGGETFLASLSLSLALVELAGRAGGRLEALFLDEGFGSLDAGSLGEALDALTQKAEGGRLVAVISHLRSVAEAIDQVLVVRASPGGSRAAWVSAEERDRMLSEDVERGLLA